MELKKHAQSICLLLSTLQAGDLAHESSFESTVPILRPSPTFDFLDDLYTPYANASPLHHLPLPSVLNTLPPLTPKHHYAPGSPSCAVLKTAEETGDVNTLMAHVNENLEMLDHRFSAQGGLLALLPLHGKNGTESERGIFGQWLHYTQALVGRVAELEREVVLMRELLGGERVTPSVRGRSTAGGKAARELVFPQDRYILAGLSDSLWAQLNEELDITAQMAAAQEWRAGEQLRPRRWSGECLDGRVEDRGEGRDAVSWVEVTSRIFRVQGQESVFVIPAWDLHPGAEAVRKIENQPLVQTVTRGTNQLTRLTAKERKDRRKEIETLKKENDDLRSRLQYEKDQMQQWFGIWEAERKERMEELDAEKEKWESMQRVLEISGLEQLLYSENDLSQGST